MPETPDIPPQRAPEVWRREVVRARADFARELEARKGWKGVALAARVAFLTAQAEAPPFPPPDLPPRPAPEGPGH